MKLRITHFVSKGHTVPWEHGDRKFHCYLKQSGIINSKRFTAKGTFSERNPHSIESEKFLSDAFETPYGRIRDAAIAGHIENVDIPKNGFAIRLMLILQSLRRDIVLGVSDQKKLDEIRSLHRDSLERQVKYLTCGMNLGFVDLTGFEDFIFFPEIGFFPVWMADEGCVRGSTVSLCLPVSPKHFFILYSESVNFDYQLQEARKKSHYFAAASVGPSENNQKILVPPDIYQIYGSEKVSTWIERFFLEQVESQKNLMKIIQLRNEISSDLIGRSLVPKYPGSLNCSMTF